MHNFVVSKSYQKCIYIYIYQKKTVSRKIQQRQSCTCRRFWRETPVPRIVKIKMRSGPQIYPFRWVIKLYNLCMELINYDLSPNSFECKCVDSEYSWFQLTSIRKGSTAASITLIGFSNLIPDEFAPTLLFVIMHNILRKKVFYKD